MTIPGGLVVANVNAHLRQEANARLIAAAPDLLEALTKIQHAARPGQEMGVSDAIDALCDIWNTARAAIARAEGRS